MMNKLKIAEHSVNTLYGLFQGNKILYKPI